MYLRRRSRKHNVQREQYLSSRSWYLTVSPIILNFIQGLLYWADLREAEVAYEPRLVGCWSMLVIGLLGGILTMLAFFKSPRTKPGYLAGHKFTWTEGLVQWESILIIVWPPGTYTRVPDARPEQQINAVGLGYTLVYSYLPTPLPSPRLVASTSLPYYLPIAGGRIFGFIPFPRVLVLCEMQSVWSRIWTRVAVSISCDDNHYTMGTSCVFPLLRHSRTFINWSREELRHREHKTM